MKKITLIASLLIVFTACQKADIRPRTVSPESTEEMKSLSTDTPDPTDPNGGDITDPLRKKDQKDNK